MNNNYLDKSLGISVIIPTYNREKFIDEAIQSVLSQNYDGDIEIIVVDDGSTDGTLDAAGKYKQQVIILPKSPTCTTQGAAATRNRGIKAATKPLISFLDSDDSYLPGHLKKMIKAMNDNLFASFVFCRCLELSQQNEKKKFKRWTRKYISKNDIKNLALSRDRIVNTNCFVFRREIFDIVGLFDESYSNAEDIDLWMRISEKFRGIFSDHYGAVYRVFHEEKQLTEGNPTLTNTIVANVFEKAAIRYANLNIKDTRRIFEINHRILYHKYHLQKGVYLYKYLYLILNSPLSFLSKFPEFVFQKSEKKNKWSDLKEFIGDKQ